MSEKQAGQGQPTDGHKLFVGDLPTDVTKEELQLVFGTYGEVTNIILMSPHPKSGQRCALLFYAKVEAAEDAIKVLNGLYKIREQAENAIKVEWAKEKHVDQGLGKGEGEALERVPDADGFKLFVGGLPVDCTEEELRTVFGTYGEVKKVHIMTPHVHSGRVAAFVFYGTNQAGDDAISLLDGKYKIRDDAELPIQVKWATSKEAKGKGKGKDKDRGAADAAKGGCGGGLGKGGDWWNQAAAEEEWAAWPSAGKGGGGKSWNAEPEPVKVRNADGWKLFVGGLPEDVSQEELTSVFSTYGEVSKVHIMQPHAMSGRVAAFVFYSAEQAAQDAIKVLHREYKIRVDAEAPIQVRWASDKQSKGEGKGGWGGDSWDIGPWDADPWFGGAHKGKGGDNGKGGFAWQPQFDGWSTWEAGWDDGWHDDGWLQGHSVGWYDAGYGTGYGKGYDKGRAEGYNKGTHKGGKKGGLPKGDEWQGRGTEPKGSGKGFGASGSKGAEAKGKDAGPSEDNDARLFVGHLPADIAEEALQYVFGTYGKVQHIHIMSGKSKTGQACAFVEFENEKDAETAILTLHEKYEIRPGCGSITVKKANKVGGRMRSQ